MKKNDDIEDLFKSAFGDFSVVPPTGLKNSIDQKIAAQENCRKRFLWVFLTIIGTLGVAGILLWRSYPAAAPVLVHTQHGAGKFTKSTLQHTTHTSGKTSSTRSIAAAESGKTQNENKKQPATKEHEEVFEADWIRTQSPFRKQKTAERTGNQSQYDKGSHGRPSTNSPKTVSDPSLENRSDKNRTEGTETIDPEENSTEKTTEKKQQEQADSSVAAPSRKTDEKNSSPLVGTTGNELPDSIQSPEKPGKK